MIISLKADALQQRGKMKKGEEKDKLILQATEKYLSIGNIDSLFELAFSLSNQALEESGPERERLHLLADHNFKAAESCLTEDNKTRYQILWGWGINLCHQVNKKINFF